MINKSENILNKGFQLYKPKKIFCMVSGGDDSLVVLHVALKLGLKPIVVHANTGTGVKETSDFVRAEAKRLNLEYIEGCNYEEYKQRVIKNGFYGQGEQAHRMAYNILKDKVFRKVVTSFRKGQRNYPIFMLNGMRKQESQRRARTSKDISIWGSNIWLNLINDWSKKDCLDFLDSIKVKRNPVAIQLCRSGECNCGTPINKPRAEVELAELKALYPDCYNEIMDLQDRVFKAGHSYGWGCPKPKGLILEQEGQQNMFPSELMMCQSCQTRV